MASQTSLKHAATEPSHLAGKGSQRRTRGTAAAGRAAVLRRAPSDSDCSGETGSLSADSADKPPSTIRAAPPPITRGNTKRSRRRGSEWEVLEGLKDGQRFEKRPEVFNGYLHKKRKWPLKGWHKRYFVVDGGILVYARGPSDVSRGRLHGSVDVGLSVISAKQRRRRIDIDADEFIYHLRAKTPELFRAWLNVLKQHRLYRQHLLTFGVRESVPRIHVPDDVANAESASRLGSPTSGGMRGPQAGFVSGTPGGRLGSWVIEPGGTLESVSRELGQAQLSVQQLQRLLEALELQQQAHHDTDASLEGASPSVKKDRRKFGLRKKKSQSSKGGSVDLQLPHHIDASLSYSALSALTAPPSPGGGASSMPNSAASLPIEKAHKAGHSLPNILEEVRMISQSSLVRKRLTRRIVFACAAARPQSLPGTESLGAAGGVTGPASLVSLTPDHQLREDFTVLAKDLVSSLKSIVCTLLMERSRHEAEPRANSAAVCALRNNLTSALHQNSELKSRLARIHDASDIADLSIGPNSDLASRQFQPSLSYSSSCVSASEFFDAEEHDDDPLKEMPADVEGGVIELEGDTSSEAGSLSSEEGSASSDNSDAALLNAESGAMALSQNGLEPVSTSSGWVRRTRLPSPRPTPGGPSLWNLLYKNIGKDLSQVSMPVTINEPLNMLQRLCEELEYSELLDAAADCKSSTERLALIASFAVSAYASAAHRAASKPFNPLLGETYECVREDKGFRFIAEQVSHHPPISVCHAESPRWTFWQEARIKTKFWGKSMEFQPAGRVHVRFHSTGDHYSWNKVTTCVHNLFGGQRWVDQYGDMHITTDTKLNCKLNFIKASSWSATRHEVRGAVVEGGGRPLRLAGRWSEALYAGDPPAAKCLWRPGAMPPENELYYGFTRFAMELNEMEPGMRDTLCHTDTRFRPDQRALEEGDVDTAERLKSQLEQAQRERRRDYPNHYPRWFRKGMEDSGEEVWVFGGEYWAARESGFPGEAAPHIW